MRQAPKGLTEESKQLWRNILTEFPDEWTSRDYKILEVGLECLDRLNEVQEQINKEGLTVKDRFKQDKINPLLATERDCRSGFLQAMKQLSLEDVAEIYKKRIGRPPGSTRRGY